MPECQKLVENFNHLSGEYLGVNEDPWMHHFEADNYLPVGGMTKEEFEKRIGAHDHICKLFLCMTSRFFEGFACELIHHGCDVVESISELFRVGPVAMSVTGIVRRNQMVAVCKL